MLPDGDGFELCREFRAQSDVPIVMLTARGDDTDRIVGLELGADDYLPKPFNPRELLARLRAVMRRRAPAAQATQAGSALRRFGRLTLDFDTREVRLDEKSVELTAYQFDLLRVLVENAGRPVSRDRLMEALRGDAIGAFDRSIDVHVSRIRAVIEDDPKKPRRIQTVRGVGYLFTRNQDDA
jgi:DNA-binding response OmpR family regulator